MLAKAEFIIKLSVTEESNKDVKEIEKELGFELFGEEHRELLSNEIVNDVVNSLPTNVNVELQSVKMGLED